MKANDITTAYVVKGFWERKAALGYTGFEDQNGPEFELMEHIIHAADDVEGAYMVLPDHCWNGVWDYDISEPYGEWLAEQFASQGLLPDDEARRAYIAHLIETEMAA